MNAASEGATPDASGAAAPVASPLDAPGAEPVAAGGTSGDAGGSCAHVDPPLTRATAMSSGGTTRETERHLFMTDDLKPR
ncbi:hypothetical protein ASG43_00740 [Aureimonas sp. Leaf454]|nr:hypothetical protein ASG43_00740 [Aureimonas sp. Leaf454]